MASNKGLTAAYEALPKLLKVILQLLLGAVVGGIYRIVRMQGGKDEMPGQRRLYRSIQGLSVAYLSDHYHVRIMAQNRSQCL